MPSVTVIFPDDMLARIDAMVAKNKAAKREPYKPTSKEMAEAHRLAEQEGLLEANRYLKSLQPSTARVSRMSLVLNLIDIGLIAVEAEAKKVEELAAKPLAQKPAKKETKK